MFKPMSKHDYMVIYAGEKPMSDVSRTRIYLISEFRRTDFR